MYIGEVSKLTGATPKAIRLYESMGLIPIPERKGKYRHYKNNDIGLIKIIKEGQQFGLKLSEIKQLINHSTSCDSIHWDNAIILMKKKSQEIDGDIKKLQQSKVKLDEIIRMLEKETVDD
ncbi:MAG: MerR family transcriptional regulator [Methylococcales bacterium]|nr:MerR family transcriptional regulator [Methylococcales bacterium]